MIHFKSISWANFISTGNTPTKIVLDKHQTTLVVGQNGAGKSTILDALSFGLYGRPFRKINKNQLINTINKKGTYVEVEFVINNHHYRVVRGIKPNIFEVYVDGKLSDQHSDVREHQEMLEKQILKLNHKSFAQVVILGSASFVPFMQLSANHRREIVEDLLDIQVFSTMNSILKDKITYNKLKMVEADNSITNTQSNIELYVKHINTLKQNNDSLISQKDQQLVTIELDIDDATSNIENINNNIKQLNDSISDSAKAKSRLEKLHDISRKIENRLTKIRKDVSFFESHDDCPTCRQEICNDHKAIIISSNNTQLEEIERGKKQMIVELDAASARLNTINDISTDISNKNREISDLLIQIRTLKTFAKQIRDEIGKLKTDTHQIDDNETELKEAEAQLSLLQSQKDELLNDKYAQEAAYMLLKDNGIKTKIIKQFVPVINKLINKYLAAMDFFVSFELNENFEETIKSRFRDDFTYDSFSEGEKMRIDLALLFAWRSIAKMRNSASTNLLIMDEVFDSSLDSSGTDEFMKIIQSLVSDTNTFIISHKGDQLVDKFEHIIRFEKHKNFSQVAQ